MSTKSVHAGQGYYFVPLGRERGGYLDFLGLAPDADAYGVSEKHLAYLEDAERAFKKGRAALREELKENKITKQEFDAKVAQLEAERTKKEQQLNELKEKYEAVVGDARRGARNARRPPDPIWYEMIRRFASAAEFWQLLARPRPLASVPVALLLEVEQNWISPHLNGATTPAQTAAAPQRTDNLPSRLARAAKAVDLNMLAALLTERDLICLLAADALWTRVRYTNREHWRMMIELWAEEVARLGPRLQQQATAAPPPIYPNLSQPTNLAIDDLQAEEMAEVAQAPTRGTHAHREQELDALLAALLAQEQEGRAQAEGDADVDESGRVRLNAQQLDELLRLLAQTEGESEAPSLADTEWEVTDSDGDVAAFVCLPTGEFVFVNQSGFRGDGTWTQQGARVLFSYPGGEAQREGTITGNTMQGTGKSVAYEYTWTAVRLK
jgi:hypothetical protein